MNEATRRQIRAASPMASTWLAANAGSGKTRVLTDRVARLLLAGVAPQNVLCLTYTKAAASEMQNRLFKRLGAWAMCPDDKLREELTELGTAGPFSAEDLAAARRLFARAIETPGGLKIQTIHAFCGALLRRFPLEAGVSPTFTEIDDRGLDELIAQALDALASSDDPSPLDAVARFANDGKVSEICEEILQNRPLFGELPDEETVYRHLGLLPGFRLEDLLTEVFLGGEAELLAQLVAHLENGSPNDVTAGQKLAGLAMAGASLDALLRLEDVFLTGKGTKEPFSAKIGKFPTKATREAMGPDLIDQLNALMQRVADTRPRRLALAAIERSLALHRFAARLLPWLETEKQRRGYLDFEDLILRARALLTDPSVAQWVLYKLDGGIDHILVDEAQDTSPAQWDVIRALAAEFASGEGARGEVQRTIFVVGDKKQSIYSFQGADPAGFDRLQTHFAAALEGSDTPLQTEELAHSFRSAPAILEAVDASFPGVSGLGDHPHHIAFKDQMPGRVDLWPVVEKLDSKDDRIWYEPVDKISPAAPPARLADAIAGHLRDLLAAGTQLPDGKGGARLMHPGDVLILVRSRGVLFNELIRACKAADLPLAGADRIKLHEELAVLDLIALLKFLALPEDDLSLATLLRSPFFGWSEDDLFRLAHPRPQGAFLWEFLRQSEAHPETRAVLDDLRSQADYLRPYELMQRLLIRHGGREKLLARLGPDCEEGVDALLQLALSYEQAEVPSLSGFLEWFAAEEVEIKRQVEGAGGNIRIMTVHGSKGLEAPVVILPDCGPVQERLRAMVHKSQAGWPVWLPDGADSTPPQLDPVRDAWISAQAAERDRLLYVAMTRAEIWLMAANAGDLGKKETWYSKIETGLRSRGAARLDTPTGPGLRLARGDWPDPADPASSTTSEDAPHLPGWALTAARDLDLPQKPLSPSDLGGAKALGGEAGLDSDTATRRGTLLHRLLEHLPNLPEAAWPRAAEALMSEGEAVALPDEAPLILAEATAVLTNPALQDLFDPTALTEVDFCAELPDGTPLHGTIDRLLVTQDAVLAVDFKSNAVVPHNPEQTPEGVLRQMGAYAHALGLIYPRHHIETAILWTKTAKLMVLPHALVTEALAKTTPRS